MPQLSVPFRCIFAIAPPRVLLYFASVHLIASWMIWAEIKCTVPVALPKQPINQFNIIQQSRQQARRAYSSNVYAFLLGEDIKFLSESPREALRKGNFKKVCRNYFGK